jgi:GTP-binding protein
MWIWLNLKLLSNVGLLGLPNAGKSTFLSIITSAKPKIADYPFTTTKPQIGVVYYDHNEFTIADLPGLIENASAGQGLGIQFLKHLERCKLLLHVIDISSDDIIKDYNIIKKEVAAFRNLKDKKKMIVLSKIDLLTDEEIAQKKIELESYTKKEVMLCSGVTKNGLDKLKRNIFSNIY